MHTLPNTRARACAVCEDKFVPKHIPTIGIDYGVKPVSVEGDTVRVNFFDMAGGDEYEEIRTEFYRDAQGAMLVFDVASKDSLDALEKWMREGEKHGLSSPVYVLVGNKTDGKKREVRCVPPPRCALGRD